jgi:hypothetical protein
LHGRPEIVPSREIVPLFGNELGDSLNQSGVARQRPPVVSRRRFGQKTAYKAAVFSDCVQRARARFAARVDDASLVSFS